MVCEPQAAPGRSEQCLRNLENPIREHFLYFLQRTQEERTPTAKSTACLQGQRGLSGMASWGRMRVWHKPDSPVIIKLPRSLLKGRRGHSLIVPPPQKKLSPRSALILSSRGPQDVPQSPDNIWHFSKSSFHSHNLNRAV